MLSARYLGLLVAGVLAACQPVPKEHARTFTGFDLGKRKWVDIEDRKSIMYIVNPPRIRSVQRNTSFYDGRNQERINLYPGFISFEQAPNTSFDTSYGLRDTFLYSLESMRSLKERYEIDVTSNDIKVRTINGIEYAYLAKQGRAGACFVAEAFFGHGYGLSLGNKHVFGAACHRLGRRILADLEDEWIGLLARLRFDGPRPGWSTADYASPRLPSKAADAFDAYKSQGDADFKVFAVGSDGQRWGAGAGHRDLDDAAAAALRDCNDSGSGCEIYALGDTVVYRMSRARYTEVKKRYSDKVVGARIDRQLRGGS